MFNFKEGDKVHLAVLAIDLSGSTELWQDFPTNKIQEFLNKYRGIVDNLIEHAGGEIFFKKNIWQGDGIWGYFYSPDSEKVDRNVISLGIQIWQVLRIEHNIHVKMASACTEIIYKEIYREEPGKIVSQSLAFLGHIMKVCPKNLFLITEDIYRNLFPQLSNSFTYFCSTRRDNVPLYVYPKTKTPADNKDFLDKEEDVNFLKDEYLRYLQDEHGWLRFPYGQDLQKVVTLPLKKVFTPLMVQAESHPSEILPFILNNPNSLLNTPNAVLNIPPEYKIIKNQPEEFEKVFLNKRHIAIIGEPGSGKSTLLKWLTLIYADGKHSVSSILKKLSHSDLEINLLPIVASIGSLYEILRKNNNVQILDALKIYYQQKQLPDLSCLFKDSLAKGRALVLLDGLDEIDSEDETKIENKTKIREYIEGFIRTYKNNRFIVTSRIAGYLEIVFPEGRTSTYMLCSLKEEQIEKLSTTWFVEFEKKEIGKEESPYCDVEGRKKAAEFLNAVKSESHLAPLTQTPLLLSLLCLAHRQGSSLPKYRVEVYDFISRTLIDLWDKVRRLSVASGPKVVTGDYRKEAPLMLYPLGLWFQENHSSNIALRKNVEDKLIELLEEKGTSEQDAKLIAKNFLDEFKKPGKTHILQEKGTDLFGFLHLTFLEFFAASAIVSCDAEEHYLKKYAYNPQWKEVIKLMFGRLSIIQGRTDRAEKLIEKILEGFVGDELQGKILQKNILLAAELVAELPILSKNLAEKIVDKFFLLLFSDFYILQQEALKILPSLKETPLKQIIYDRLLEKLRSRNQDLEFLTLPEGLEDKEYGIDIITIWQYPCLDILKNLDIKDNRIINLLSNSFKLKQPIKDKFNSAEALINLGIKNDTIIDFLIATAIEHEYENKSYKYKSARILVTLGVKDDRVIKSLLEDLNSKDTWERLESARILVDMDIEKEQVKDSLLKNLKNTDVGYLIYSVEILRDLGVRDKKIIDLLLKKLGTGSSQSTKTTAAVALEKLGINNNEMKEVLLKALDIGEDEDSRDRWFRIIAAESLEKLGVKDKKMIDAQLKKLEDNISPLWHDRITETISNIFVSLPETERNLFLEKIQKKFEKSERKHGYFHLLWKLSNS